MTVQRSVDNVTPDIVVVSTVVMWVIPYYTGYGINNLIVPTSHTVTSKCMLGSRGEMPSTYVTAKTRFILNTAQQQHR